MQNISYITYQVDGFDTLEMLNKFLGKNKENTILESKLSLNSVIEKIDKINSVGMENIFIKYLLVDVMIQRPNRSRTSPNNKHGKMLFYEINKQIFFVAYAEDNINPKLIPKGIFQNKKINYEYFNMLKQEEFKEFVGWIINYALEEDKNDRILDKDKQMILLDFKAYKALNDDGSAKFKGNSDTGIIDCREAQYMLIGDGEINYIKVKLQYKSYSYEFVISSSEKDNFKLYYQETLNSTLTTEYKGFYEFIIYLNHVVYPYITEAFAKSKWNEKNQLELIKRLIDEFITELTDKKEELDIKILEIGNKNRPKLELIETKQLEIVNSVL